MMMKEKIDKLDFTEVKKQNFSVKDSINKGREQATD